MNESSTSSSFLFSPANPNPNSSNATSSTSNSSTSSFHHQPLTSINTSHVNSDRKNSLGNGGVGVGLESSPSSSSRDSNQAPFSLSSSSSSSQSLQSNLSWQTDNTSFGGNQTTSPGGEADGLKGNASNLNSNLHSSRPSSSSSSSNGYPMTSNHSQQSNLRSPEPNLTFTSTLRFNESNPASARQSPSNSNSDLDAHSRRNSLKQQERDTSGSLTSRTLSQETAANTLANSKSPPYHLPPPPLPASFTDHYNQRLQAHPPPPPPPQAQPSYDLYPNHGHLYNQHLISSGVYPQEQSWPDQRAPTPTPPREPSPPKAPKHRVTTTLWEDEQTLCYQVDSRGFCVARRGGELAFRFDFEWERRTDQEKAGGRWRGIEEVEPQTSRSGTCLLDVYCSEGCSTWEKAGS